MSALHARVDGEAGDWIVLSNSLGADLSMWEPQMPTLTARHRVLRYDARGHGASPAPPGPYSLTDLEDDVVALMDERGIERAAFMGLSMGGMVGMGLALRHPARIARLVVADARADAPAPWRAMWDERVARVRAGGLAAVVDGTLSSWLTQAWRDANPEGAARLRAMVLACDPGGYAACCAALKGLDRLRDLPRLTVPTLYIGGAQDAGAPPDVMRAMADATPGGRYTQIPDAAHVANIDAPEAFTEAVAGFLGV